MTVLGAIEAGGTKFVCAVSDNALNIIERVSIPTTVPEETMEEVVRFFKQYDVDSFGIGSFGPIDVSTNSETYGYITSTPKPGWNQFDFVGYMKQAFNKPIYWTTDVNAAAYGEYKLGAARGIPSSMYLTIGTGVGGGAVINGEIFNGYSHPEMGHIKVQRHPDDNKKGACPYHGDCLEGLASGSAIEKRFGQKGTDLPETHEAWEFTAYYLAQALMNYSLILSPERIILGGGVMKQAHLLPMIQEKLEELMAGYMVLPPMSEYVQTPGLKDNAGITGCLLLAHKSI
ncbi:ROK family protein [Aerococcaceae bacterium DSM 111021]|nr:ROK family protein [Aerococcaceae bacterium DSM 111021]